MKETLLIETYADQEPKEWQDFVNSSALFNIFQTIDWAKAMRAAGHNTLLVVAKDAEENIKGGMLGIHQRYSLLRLGISSRILVWGGPLVYDTNDKTLIETLVRAFDAQAKKLGAVDSFIRSFVSLDDTLVSRLKYVVEHDRLPCTLIIDLTQSTDDLWKQLQERGRRGIRKAIKNGVIVEEGRTINDFLAYYQIAQKTATRLEIGAPSLRIIESLWKTFSQSGKFKLFLAKYRAKTIAGVLAVRWRDKMWGWHGASLAEYWNLNANLLTHWRMIEWGSTHQVGTYDLMGIPCKRNTNHPRDSLYLFKTQLGGKIVRQGEYVKEYSRFKKILLSKVLVPIGKWL